MPYGWAASWAPAFGREGLGERESLRRRQKHAKRVRIAWRDNAIVLGALGRRPWRLGLCLPIKRDKKAGGFGGIGIYGAGKTPRVPERRECLHSQSLAAGRLGLLFFWNSFLLHRIP